MNSIDDLARSIKRQADKARQAQMRFVECKDVDWEARTMTAAGTADDVEYLDVLLGIGSTYTKPAIGSVCLIGIIEGQEVSTFLIWAEEVEIVEAASTDIVINDGRNGGLVKVKELIDHVNTIEKDLNTIKNVFVSWTAVPNDGGAALKAAAASWAGQKLELTTREEIENENIKH